MPRITRTTRLARRSVHAFGAAMLVAGAALIGAAPAQAADQDMTITPSSGTNQVSPTFVLSAGCPAAATSFAALMFGGSFPAEGQLIGAPGNIGLSTSAFSFEASISFQDAAADAGFSTLSGTYTAKAICQDDLSNVLRTFAAPVTFSSPTTYTSPAGGGPSPTPSPSSSSSPSASTSPSPSSSASPSSSESGEGTVVITDADGTELGANPDLVNGQAVTVVADGFTADEEVTVTLNSTPTTLDPTTADADGLVIYDFTVPADLEAGAHTLVFEGADQTVTVDFTVSASDTDGTDDGSLPATGPSLVPRIALGLGLIAAGWLAVSYARRHGLLRFGGDGDLR